MDKNINVTRPSLPPYEEYTELIKEIWESGWLTNFGPLENRLAGELKAYLDAPNVTLFTNGHQALAAAVRLIAGNKAAKAGIEPYEAEIITTPFTFISTTYSITEAGFKPVFADVDPVTYTLDPAAVEKLINSKTAAILPVHVYGTLCDVDAFEAISRRYHIPVVYDAAHCFGVSRSGRGVASFGAASMFSFHATKAYNTIEGGAVATADAALAEALRAYCGFGLAGGADAGVGGTNAKMTEFAAAMGICNLRHIDEVLEKRRGIHGVYTDILTEGKTFDPETGAVSGLEIKLLPQQRGVTRNYAYFPVVFKDSETALAVLSELSAQGVHARRYFYPLTSSALSVQKYAPASTPVAESIADRVIALPFYADLSAEDAAFIAQTVVGTLEKRG